MNGAGPKVTTANLWRWEYPRPADLHSAPLDAARLSQELFSERDRDKSKRRQVEQKRSSGFPGHDAVAGHNVVWKLRRRGYSHTVAQLAGHYVSMGGTWNFQGNPRLGRWLSRSDRTVRRARAVLERDGWVRSHLLLPGDRVPGQRAAVVRPQVVRDVSKLQRLGAVGQLQPSRSASSDQMRAQRSAVGQRSRSDGARAGDTPAAVWETPADTSADELDALAVAQPQFAAFFQGMAAAKRRRERKPPPNAATPPPTPEDIDAWDAETERRAAEFELTQLEELSRGPPLPDDYN